MYKAAFIDMDGTLLTKSHEISNVTKLTIKRLISQGILIVPISARPLHGMLHITEGVIPEETPIVSLNGGYIYHRGKIIYEVNIPLTAAKAVHAAIETMPLSAMYYSQMNWYAQEHTDAIKKEQKITPVPIIIQPFEHTITAWELQQLGPNKILIAGDEKLILTIEKDLLTAHGEQLNIYKSQPRYLELMNLQASKTMAMQLLMKQYGIQQHEVVAIGDNYNDQGMIEFAGMGIAMGNAPDTIKSVANYVTDTNNNDGVAKALEHFFG
jgi:Cof subfamily protein (haloacid dehalogenase superfamily)